MRNYEAPTIRELVEKSSPVPEGTDIATVIIANTESEQLSNAIHNTLYASDRLNYMSDENRVVEAQFNQELAAGRIVTSDTQKEVRKQLESRLLDRRFALVATQAVKDEVETAYAISNKRYDLAKPLRYATILACSVAMGGGFLGPILSRSEIHKTNVENIRQFNETASPEYRISEKNDSSSTTFDVMIGVIALVGTGSGGIAGLFINDKMSKTNNRLARNRAKRKIKKASK